MNIIKRAALAIKKDFKDEEDVQTAGWMIKYGFLPGVIIAIIVGTILVVTGNP